MDELADRLEAVERQLAEFHLRAAHRETVIDRLHEDNQRLKQGEHRVVLEPVIADLVRLYEHLALQAQGTPEDGMLGDFAVELTGILDRCGVETFHAVPGEPYQSERHKPLGIVPTSDRQLHNTVAQPVAAGFYDREIRRVRRPAQARFHQYSRGD
ncbi:MAG TPA: molecular chaperone GrpE [Streptosporangiaceae bacterium]|nr:molecular chaperone GrpE [Streptosporangiaceae bacterium]